MISKKEIENWLASLPENDHCFIDDGGLTLRSAYCADAFIEIGGDNEWLAEWLGLYEKSVDGPHAVTCDECGYTLHGDKPEIAIECLDCFMKRKAKEDERRGH